VAWVKEEHAHDSTPHDFMYGQAEQRSNVLGFPWLAHKNSTVHFLGQMGPAVKNNASICHNLNKLNLPRKGLGGDLWC
jgi:hypothetical protein